MRGPLIAWLAVVLWAALIYTLSDQPHLHVTHGIVDFALRKAAHVTEYALLTVLIWRALELSGISPAAAWAVPLAIAYAASDEYHQTFVAGRQGTPRDVAIDAIGVCGAAYLVTRLRRPRPVTA